MTTHKRQPSRWKTARRRWWLFALLLIAGLVLGRYWYAARLEMRLVRVVPFGGYVLTTEPALIACEKLTTVARFDWNGREIWRVQGPKMDDMRGADNFARGFYYDVGRDVRVSPNGKYLAMAIKKDNITRVQAWRDGVRVGDYGLALDRDTGNPLAPYAEALVYPQNNGVVYLVVDTFNKPKLVQALKDGKVIGRGLFPARTELTPSGHYQLVRTRKGWQYCKVTIIGKRVTLVPQFSISGGVGKEISPLSDGTIYYEGKVYRADGTIVPPNPGWKILPAYTYQWDNGIIEQNEKLRRRCLYRLATGTRRQLPYSSRVEMRVMNVTEDGRFYVQHTIGDNLPMPLQRLVGQLAPKRLPFTHYIDLYVAPHSLRGRVSFHWRGHPMFGGQKQFSSDGYVLPDGRRMQLSNAYPSPDGRGFVAEAYSRLGPAAVAGSYQVESSGALLFFRK